MDGTSKTRSLRFRGLAFPGVEVLPGAVRRAMRAGEYDEALIAAALRHARTDDSVLIVGGGPGHIAGVLAARLGVPRVTVTEPDPRLAAMIRGMAEENGLPRIALRPGLVAGAPGQTRLSAPKDPFGAVPGSAEDGPEVPLLGMAALERDHAPTLLIASPREAESLAMAESPFPGLRAAILCLTPDRDGPAGTDAALAAMAAAGLTYAPRHSAGALLVFRREA
ncbi:hypothetical protein RM543_08620 [Roseicyclus sp. F158]|uniref:Uncharacterized protein n=1 Tax=Tropicimonas omnivorans TaxID=3075590 RepID=A0ABU3DG97_9RHOB|nr:hypothetical protein [Roseicyclus sp. F158]MDT0682748.1 hypothetical protein [Roseicyclus sp. F158]